MNNILLPHDAVPYARELLTDSLDLAPDTDNLHDAINAVLRNRPSVAHVDRVIRHLRDDDFDFMSAFAHDAADHLAAYRETLILDA